MSLSVLAAVTLNYISVANYLFILAGMSSFTVDVLVLIILIHFHLIILIHLIHLIILIHELHMVQIWELVFGLHYQGGFFQGHL